MRSHSTGGFWNEVTTDAVRRAALRYERPSRSSFLNDPYHDCADANAANALFLHNLSRYRSRSLAPIVLAAQADVAYLQARMAGCRGWILVCAVIACFMLSITGLQTLAGTLAVPPLAIAFYYWREARQARAELERAEAFVEQLQAWTLQFKLVSVGSHAMNRAVA